MVTRGVQHTTNNISGRHTLRARNATVNAALFGILVHVLAIHNARVVTVNNVVNLVLFNDHVQVFWGHDVGCAGNNLVNPLASSHGSTALLIVHDRCSTLALLDTGVAVDANHKIGTEGTTLAESVHMTVVHHIKGAVHPNANRALVLVKFILRIQIIDLALKFSHLTLRLSELGGQHRALALVALAKEHIVQYQGEDHDTHGGQELLLRRVRLRIASSTHEPVKAHLEGSHRSRLLHSLVNRFHAASVYNILDQLLASFHGRTHACRSSRHCAEQNLK
mmetsp:Transcript_16230/g.31423  ORF Transcript_16230/g.31423 Transcript_16230/m.31423 type:complete len:279 (+) Transcript_16230:1004-1840(+)